MTTKYINITYHMAKPNEVAESCITLPMTDAIADDILEHGESSQHLDLMRNGEVARILRSLATIQGYEYVDACCPTESPWIHQAQ
jgi:hypothetical protein